MSGYSSSRSSGTSASSASSEPPGTRCSRNCGSRSPSARWRRSSASSSTSPPGCTPCSRFRRSCRSSERTSARSCSRKTPGRRSRASPASCSCSRARSLPDRDRPLPGHAGRAPAHGPPRTRRRDFAHCNPGCSKLPGRTRPQHADSGPSCRPRIPTLFLACPSRSRKVKLLKINDFRARLYKTRSDRFSNPFAFSNLQVGH